MPQILYRCCEVADYRPRPDKGALKADCWICGSPDFEFVEDVQRPDLTYSFLYVTGRMIRPTEHTPPWRV